VANAALSAAAYFAGSVRGLFAIRDGWPRAFFLAGRGSETIGSDGCEATDTGGGQISLRLSGTKPFDDGAAHAVPVATVFGFVCCRAVTPALLSRAVTPACGATVPRKVFAREIADGGGFLGLRGPEPAALPKRLAKRPLGRSIVTVFSALQPSRAARANCSSSQQLHHRYI